MEVSSETSDLVRPGGSHRDPQASQEPLMTARQIDHRTGEKAGEGIGWISDGESPLSFSPSAFIVFSGNSQQARHDHFSHQANVIGGGASLPRWIPPPFQLFTVGLPEDISSRRARHDEWKTGRRSDRHSGPVRVGRCFSRRHD